MSFSKSWRGIWLLALVSTICLVGAGLAEEEGGPKGKGKKGKGKKSQMVLVDLKKLPKDLAREVKQYAEPSEDFAQPKKGKKGKGKGKGADAEEKGKGYGKGEKGKGYGKGEKGKDFGKGKGKKDDFDREDYAGGKKGKKGKKGSDYEGGSDLDRRLDRLARDIEELRRELRRR